MRGWGLNNIGSSVTSSRHLCLSVCQLVFRMGLPSAGKWNTGSMVNNGWSVLFTVDPKYDYGQRRGNNNNSNDSNDSNA